MKKFFSLVIKLRYVMIALFLAATVLCAFLRQYVSVNYDMNDYLPPESASTRALDVMDAEFDGAIPNARVMVRNVDKKEALAYKEKIEAVDGVISVSWLDTFSDDLPIEMYPKKMQETYYKDGNALFTVTFDEKKQLTAVNEVREIIGDDNAMTGTAINTVTATNTTMSEIKTITVCSVIFLFFVLILTTSSFMHAPAVMIGLGSAVVINMGTNLIFGEISFVSNSAGTILQLAVSLDYSVFLIHRFDELRENKPAKDAMCEALTASMSSILSSGLTTVIGFLALCMMQYRIGPDLGLVLAKGVVISLLTVFLFMPGVILMLYPLMDKTKHRPFLPPFRRFGRFVRKITVPIAILLLITAIPAYITSNSNTYYFGASKIFGPETQLGADTQAIEDIFGQNDTWVLMVPRGSKANEKALIEALENDEDVTSVTSLSSYAADIPDAFIPDSIREQLQSEHYDRIVLNMALPYEGDTTVAAVNRVRALGEKYFPGEWYLAGNAVSTADLREAITADMVKVNLLAIGAVFIVLLFTMRNFLLPVILVLTIETAIWINLSIPYLTGETLFYIAYLILSSIQLGATVDYAILFTNRYREFRAEGLSKRDCIPETISATCVSILTSGFIMSVIGFLLGKLSSHRLLAQLGMLLAKGTLCSMFAVLFALPGLLYLCDRLIMIRRRDGQ